MSIQESHCKAILLSAIAQQLAPADTVQRQGAARSALVDSGSAAELCPWMERFAQKDAYLMTDENRVYLQIGKKFAWHLSMTHSVKDYARSGIHNNNTESFNSIS